MPGYFIYVKGDEGNGRSRCNPLYSQSTKTSVHKTVGEKERFYNHHRVTPTKAAGVTIAAASKINSYVGELTNNTVLERRVGVGLTGAGLLATAVFWNPAVAAIAAGIYVGNAIATYEITKYKQGLSADYLRQSSGGLYKTR